MVIVHHVKYVCLTSDFYANHLPVCKKLLKEFLRKSIYICQFDLPSMILCQELLLCYNHEMCR